MKLKKLISVLLVVALLSCGMVVSAIEPYNGYTYDEYDEGIPATNGYQVSRLWGGDSKNSAFLDAPQDIFLDDNGNIYILNQGSSGVIILKNDFTFVRQIKEFTHSDGTVLQLIDPRSVFVKDGLIYITDYEGQCIVISDLYGKINKVLTKPDNPVFPQEKEFKPYSVAVDGQGSVYALVLDVYQGAAVFTASCEFKGFFGGNKVTPTLSLLMDRFWQSIMSNEAKDSFSNYVPQSPNNIDVSDDGFLYTCSSTSDYDESNLRCVTPAGAELWMIYGDSEFGVRKGTSYKTNFIDIATSDSGYAYGLDSTMCRVFIFDAEQELLFTFGGNGEQKGLFSQPIALDIYKNDIYVLDSAQNSVTVFTPTEYGKAVLNALVYYEDGQYAASMEGWQSVLAMDGNRSLAYNGIGKALLYGGEYKQAQEYFKLASNREDESRAFEFYRQSFIRQNLPVFIITAVLLVGLVVAAKIIIGKHRRRRCSFE